METKKITFLVKLMESSNLSVMEINDNDFSIRLEKGTGQVVVPMQMPLQAPVAVAATPAAAAPASPVGLMQGEVSLNDVTEIKSPMVGVFYAQPKPDAPAYVTRGSKIKKGDVVCIIEAMKLMNEVVAECDGEVVDICVENGQVVEFGQVLFKVF